MDPAARADSRPRPPAGYVYLWGHPADVPKVPPAPNRLRAQYRVLDRLLQCETCGQAGVCVVWERHPTPPQKRFYVGNGPRSGSYHEKKDEHSRALLVREALQEGLAPVFGPVRSAATRAAIPLVTRGLRPLYPTGSNTVPMAWAPVENLGELSESSSFRTTRTGDLLRVLVGLSKAVREGGVPWWRFVAEGLGEVFDLAEFARCWPAAGPRLYRGGNWPDSVRVAGKNQVGWPFWLTRSPFV